jgi:protein-L-isoaspartate(D-aspartate) O-methyltransferase
MLQTVYSHCLDLVTTIEQQLGRSLVPSVRNAMLHVPRHLFVSHYYEGTYINRAPSLSGETACEEWLSAIYRDQALTTQIDRRGLPTSSSSQPSLMAVMLEQLSISPGMRILEIGTGTGYNAALLAVLAEDPCLVTTVDLDPALIDLARSRIVHAVGTGMTICACNGLNGYQPHAPYDRIIATGSFLPVPWAWIEQLAPNGKLVMDLRGRIGGGLITITKKVDGTATGQFLTGWDQISFMGLRSSLEELAIPSSPKEYQRLPLQETWQLSPDDPAYSSAFHFCTYERFHGQEQELNLWLQWQFSGLGIKWKSVPKAGAEMSALLIDYPTQTVAKLQPSAHGIEILVHGGRPLWSEIEACVQDWRKSGQPGRKSYTLSIDQQGRQKMKLSHQGVSHTLFLADHQRIVS